MTNTPPRKGRTQFLLLAVIFIGPLAIAAWMYFTGSAVPEGRTNHGALLQPIVPLAEVLPESALLQHGEGRWVLMYANPGACGEDCEFSLYTLRQSRLMLGREMDRLVRVFLHGETLPDTVSLGEQHQGLVTLRDEGLSDLLDSSRPDHLARGGYFLVDPLGNLVMYFPRDIDPSDMVEDIKRLLKQSRIG